MTKSTIFNKEDQLDAENKVIDQIYTITETETITEETKKTMSGTEVKVKLLELEELQKERQKKLNEVTEKINFLKNMIKDG